MHILHLKQLFSLIIHPWLSMLHTEHSTRKLYFTPTFLFSVCADATLMFLKPRIHFHINFFFLAPQSQYFMTPSQPHVATFEVSWGCHSTPTHTSSCALNLLYSFVVFQSHTYTLPSASPEIK